MTGALKHTHTHTANTHYTQVHAYTEVYISRNAIREMLTFTSREEVVFSTLIDSSMFLLFPLITR